MANLKYRVFSPITDNTYPEDLQLDVGEMVDYWTETGHTKFAILDAFSLEYYGEFDFNDVDDLVSVLDWLLAH